MENTINQCLNQKFVINKIEDIEYIIRTLIDDLNDDYELCTDERGIKGPLIKYGYLDLVFKNSNNQFILVFCEGENIGYREERKKPMDVKLSLPDYMNKYLSNIDLFLPVSLTITDCCHTNDDSIWREKHLYI